MNSFTEANSAVRHLAHFDALFAAKDDPWDTRTRATERFKRRAVLRALGAIKRSSGIELGCGNGVSARELSKCFKHLWCVDGSSHAVSIARRETRSLRHVSILETRLPCELPRGVDAIIASEILYYLPPKNLVRTLREIYLALRAGGVLISVNHFKRFSDSERSLAEISRLTANVFGRPQLQIIGPCWRLDRYQLPGRARSVTGSGSRICLPSIFLGRIEGTSNCNRATLADVTAA